MIDTSINITVEEELMENYFNSLVNCFFKILPIRENGEDTLPIYIGSLQVELLGCKELIKDLNNDSNFITLASILQYLKDHPESSVKDVKREVFKAISICKKLKATYEKAVE